MMIGQYAVGSEDSIVAEGVHFVWMVQELLLEVLAHVLPAAWSETARRENVLVLIVGTGVCHIADPISVVTPWIK